MKERFKCRGNRGNSFDGRHKLITILNKIIKNTLDKLKLIIEAKLSSNDKLSRRQRKLYKKLETHARFLKNRNKKRNRKTISFSFYFSL